MTRSLVQVQFMKQGTQSQCTGTTQRDGWEREVGGGFGIGDTCVPVADSCQCTAETTILPLVIKHLDFVFQQHLLLSWDLVC